MVRIAVVDYGVGNMHSICRGIELAGAEAKLTNKPEEIDVADAIVLPGVGAFRSAMEQLEDKLEVIKEAVSAGKPLLGVCLGMQLLLTRSEEGDSQGLDLVPGQVLRLPKGLKVPHMGWNSIELKKEHPIVSGITSGSYVYFVHSYYIRPRDMNVTVATTNYGVEFPSVITWGSIIGTQFHPEKSGKLGLQILRNFVGMVKV
jgi:glutamine amidotransferase